MYGRSCRRLLAISTFILIPALLRGQAAFKPRPEAAPVVTIPLLPGVGQPQAATAPGTRFRILPPGIPPKIFGFRVMAQAAGAIFSGVVTGIARGPAARGQAVETVAITFHVENAIRGATPGQDLTISQWIGLWSGAQRYRIGERVLLFLYPPSKLGLTSCVAAGMGRFQIDSQGRILLSAQHLSALRADPVLDGKSRARFSDFALAVKRANEEE